MLWTEEIVRHPPKLVPEEVMEKWVRELTKEGVQIAGEKLREEPKGSRAFLPRTFIYVAMSRLMVRRLARS